MSRIVEVRIRVDVDAIDRNSPVLDALGLDERWLELWRRCDAYRWRQSRDHLYQALAGLREDQEAHPS